MRLSRCIACASALLLSLLLSGCSYFIPTKRHLPVPKTPTAIQTVSPEELVKQLNEHWDALNTLTATVEIYATQTKTAEGTVTDFPSCRGYILMRKPKMLRVAGTYFGVKIFDLASNAHHFTLVIPDKNTVLEGSDTVTQKSENPLENLRPDFFLDAIAVRGLDPEEEYMVSSDTETVEDAAKKHLYTEPEYVLSVMRPKTGHQIQPVRTITFHRDDMLPYDQYVYDKNGALETQIFYSNYQIYTAGKYPSKITIKRPQEGIQIVLSVERVDENLPGGLPDSQFEEKIPDGATIKELK
jgi:outer membrane lipoprotein-sorting protein